MKKSSVYDLVDAIFWGVILAFPLIAYVVYLCGVRGSVPMAFTAFLTDTLPLLVSGTVFETITEMFTNYLPFFSSMSWVAVLLTWFCFVEYAHVVFDILVFIPRWCHSMIDKFCGRYGK